MNPSAEFLLGKNCAAACAESYEQAKRTLKLVPHPFQIIHVNHCDVPSVPLPIPGHLRAGDAVERMVEGVDEQRVKISLVGKIDGEPKLLFDLPKAIELLLEEGHATWRRPVSTWLPFNYRVVPALFRHRIYEFLISRRRHKHSKAMEGTWPLWPAMEIIRGAASHVSQLHTTTDDLNLDPLWITHDVDDAEGLPFALQLASIEEELGLQATYFIPAILLKAHTADVERIQSKGHRIGLHGINHDNRHLQFDPAVYLKRIESYSQLLDRFEIKAYRAPSLLMRPSLKTALASRFAIDSSIPDTDVYSEASDHRGCGYWRPYRSCGLWEVPLTLPMDDRLFTMIGKYPERILEIWKEKARWIRAHDGLVVLATHTQPGMYKGLGFEAFLTRTLRLLLEETS